MITKTLGSSALAATLLIASLAFAADDPRHIRHELMEDVGKAAKVIGGMLKGEVDYDAAAVTESLTVFQGAAAQLGDLFPAGSESGEGTEAAPSIWEDRGGFDEAIAKWQQAIESAVEASPGTLEEAKPVLGPIFQTCKGCHDNYRIADE
jgi:cytochrome c556